MRARVETTSFSLFVLFRKANEELKVQMKSIQVDQRSTIRPRRQYGMSPRRRTAYYSMGAVAFCLCFVVVGYQFAKSRSNVNRSEASIATQRHHPNAPLPKKEAFSEGLKFEFNEMQNRSLPDRIGYWSRIVQNNLEGRARVAALAGKNKVDDTAPLVPDAYDCTTFVEVISALARSRKPEEFVPNLIAIRYQGGKPGFTRRNHFPEADWIPNNQKAGILRDVTFEVASRGGVVAQLETKMIDRQRWLEAHIRQKVAKRRLASIVQENVSRPVEAQVSYIEITHLKEIIDKIPSGTVMNLVHRSNDGHPVLITHQGFIIRDGKRVLLRHASIGGLIRTNDLYSYLTGLKKKEKRQLWPLIGINLNQIMDSTSANNFFREAM